MFRPSEWCFGVSGHVLPEESAQERCECFIACQLFALPVEGELVPVKHLFQPSDELPTKNAAERPTGKKKWEGERTHRAWSRDHSAAGHDTVNVRMPLTSSVSRAVASSAAVARRAGGGTVSPHQPTSS